MIIIKNGNLLEHDGKFIGHQVNCQGVMGGGVAKQIKNKWYNVYESYSSLCKNTQTSLLGKSQYLITDDDKVIFNLFGQDFYGTDKRYTDYDALSDAVCEALGYVKFYNIARNKHEPLALPYLIGCGLAGGDWYVVKKILEDLSYTFNVDIILYKLGE